MARRSGATLETTTTRARRPPPASSITFVLDGEERRVDLRAPRSIRRGGRRVVQLIDLWVASLLPGDFLELTFEIVTSGSGGVRCSAPLEALQFAHGFVDLDGRELWWDDPTATPLQGLRAQAIVVLDGEPRRTVVPPKPPESRVGPVLDLHRLLPRATCGYPAVEWRSVPVEIATRRTG